MDFFNQLKDQHEKFVSLETKNITDLEDTLSFYESVIPEFFSRDGEGKGIRKMYDDIKECDSDLTIESFDVEKGNTIYKEYLEGMYKFINDISDASVVTESTDLSQFQEKFERAKNNDSAFIESLFGGTLNEKITVSITESTECIEFLIDYIPQIKSMKTDCRTVQESNNGSNKLLNEGLQMLFESVENYCYTTLTNILTSYEDIQQALSNKNSEVAGDEYKLF